MPPPQPQSHRDAPAAERQVHPPRRSASDAPQSAWSAAVGYGGGFGPGRPRLTASSVGRGCGPPPCTAARDRGPGRSAGRTPWPRAPVPRARRTPGRPRTPPPCGRPGPAGSTSTPRPSSTSAARPRPGRRRGRGTAAARPPGCPGRLRGRHHVADRLPVVRAGRVRDPLEPGELLLLQLGEPLLDELQLQPEFVRRGLRSNSSCITPGLGFCTRTDRALATVARNVSVGTRTAASRPSGPTRNAAGRSVTPYRPAVVSPRSSGGKARGLNRSASTSCATPSRRAAACRPGRRRPAARLGSRSRRSTPPDSASRPARWRRRRSRTARCRRSRGASRRSSPTCRTLAGSSGDQKTSSVCRPAHSGGGRPRRPRRSKGRRTAGAASPTFGGAGRPRARCGGAGDRGETQQGSGQGGTHRSRHTCPFLLDGRTACSPAGPARGALSTR